MFMMMMMMMMMMMHYVQETGVQNYTHFVVTN